MARRRTGRASGGTFRGRRERRDPVLILVVRFPRRLHGVHLAEEIGRPVGRRWRACLAHVFIGGPDELPTWRGRCDDRRRPDGRIRDRVRCTVTRLVPVRIFPEVVPEVSQVAVAGRLADPRGMREDRAIGVGRVCMRRRPPDAGRTQELHGSSAPKPDSLRMPEQGAGTRVLRQRQQRVVQEGRPQAYGRFRRRQPPPIAPAAAAPRFEGGRACRRVGLSAPSSSKWPAHGSPY